MRPQHIHVSRTRLLREGAINDSIQVDFLGHDNMILYLKYLDEAFSYPIGSSNAYDSYYLPLSYSLI